MQALEAMTLLIAQADKELRLNSTIGTDNPDLSEDEQRLQLAAAVCQAMLNTALPVARFRCFVSFDEVPGKQDAREFTVSAVSVEDIKAAIRFLGCKKTIHLQATLFEQRATGADMVSGYQGSTGPKFFRWLQSLDDLPKSQTVQ